MRYAAFARLTEPAKPSAQIWRLLLGIVVVAAVMIGLTRSFFLLLQLVMEEDAYWTRMAEIDSARTPLGLLILLMLIGAMGVGAMVATEMVHRRTISSLFGPWPLFWRQFRAVTVALIVLYGAIALLPPWPLSQDLQPGLAPVTWVGLLPLTLLALLIQTGSEELLFRGYLQSQIAARFRHPAIWLIVPSALFAVGHYAPEAYGSNAGLIALWAFVFGLAAADLTARAGTLGPAMALHLINNLLAIGLISLQGEMSGLALFLLPFGPEDEAAMRALLPLDLITIGLSWLAARIAIRA